MFIVFSSHRSRDNILRTLPRKPKDYWSWDRKGCSYGIYDLTEDEVKSIKGEKGWRKLRGPHDDLRECIDWGNKAEEFTPRSG